MITKEQNHNPNGGDKLERFNRAWKEIQTTYSAAPQQAETRTPGQKALAVLATELRKISPLPIINFIDNAGTSRERVSPVPGLELEGINFPLGRKTRVLTLAFLPNPTPRFQLFEARQNRKGKKELAPVAEGAHQEIFEAKSPSAQIQMLKKALWKICTHSTP